VGQYNPSAELELMAHTVDVWKGGNEMDEFLETYVDEVMDKQVYRSGIFSRPSIMGRLRRRFSMK